MLEIKRIINSVNHVKTRVYFYEEVKSSQIEK